MAIIKASSQDTGGQFCLIEVLENEGEGPLHVHHNEDETFYVLEGQVKFKVGDKTIPAGPGAVLFAPSDVPHRYTVRGGPARIMYLCTPGGFEEMVRATSAPASERRMPREGEGMPDFETHPETVRRFG